MTPIERTARALMALEYPEEAGGEMGEFYMDRHGEAYRAQVRAVLQAIREPSVDMAVVGGNRKHMGSGDLWRAMIDALLAEGGDGRRYIVACKMP